MKRIRCHDAGLERFRPWVASLVLLLSTLIGLGRLSGLTLAAESDSSKAQKVDFNREVRPILAKNCFACHGQDEAKRAKGLRLDRRESAVKPLKSGETAIVPGDPESSELIARITEEDETLRMPPRKAGNRLSAGRGRRPARAGSSKGPSTPSTGP